MKVWVNGCFDILHTGHLDLLEYAKNLGNVRNFLIVGIDSDNRVKELKGENRPINSQEDRKRMLESLRFVDKVVIFDSSDDLRNQVLACDVEYMVVGDEYADKEVIGMENSKKGCVYYRVDNRSTTNIIDKIRKTL
jgi:D-beta-D-heptose 7-phosphate kinase/D-beta-D-heptose 1-phosphate adenosyltransferase